MNGYALSRKDVEKVLNEIKGLKRNADGNAELGADDLAEAVNRLVERKLSRTPDPSRRKFEAGVWAAMMGGDYQDPSLFEDEVPKDSSGFRGISDFLRTLAFKPHDPRLGSVVKMEVGDGESGGYLVPVEHHDKLFTTALEKSVLVGKVQRERMKTTEEKFPAVIDVDHSGGTVYGGIQFRWVKEKGTKTPSEPKLGEITLKAKTTASLCRISNQLLEDSKPSVERAVRSLFADALSWALDGVILSGTGAGMPLGILNSPALVRVPPEGAQPAGTIIFENVMNMYSRLSPAYRPGAMWLASPTTLPQIMSMSLPVGMGGSAMLIAAGAGVAPIPEKLFGVPLFFSEHCAALGAEGDIVLVQPRAYLLGVRREMAVAVSIHVHFATNETLLRFEWRGDGQPIPVGPQTIKSGAGFTVSPFVTLEARI